MKINKKKQKCPLCGKEITTRAKHCSSCSKLGKENGNWNKGTSEYPNHSQFKINRLIILNKYNNKCSICGNKAEIVHHIDNSKNNHNIDNLLPFCRKCHHKTFICGRHKKVLLNTHVTVRMLADYFNINTTTIYSWIKNNKKTARLNNMIKSLENI